MMNNEFKIVYDTVSVPHKVAMNDIIRIMKSDNIIIWDSINGGCEPKVYGDLELEIKDLNK